MSDPTPEPESQMRQQALERLMVCGLSIPQEIANVPALPGFSDGENIMDINITPNMTEVHGCFEDATVGPWFWEDDGNTITVMSSDARVPIAVFGMSGAEEAINDASLIVALRNNLGAIIEEYARLREQNTAMGEDQDALIQEMTKTRARNTALEEDNKRLYSTVREAARVERERCAQLLEERAHVSREMGAERDAAASMAGARLIRDHTD